VNPAPTIATSQSADASSEGRGVSDPGRPSSHRLRARYRASNGSAGTAGESSERACPAGQFEGLALPEVVAGRLATKLWNRSELRSVSEECGGPFSQGSSSPVSWRGCQRNYSARWHHPGAGVHHRLWWARGVIVPVARLSRLARVLPNDELHRPVSLGPRGQHGALHERPTARMARPHPCSRKQQRRRSSAPRRSGSQRADDNREHRRRKPDDVTVSVLI
jgi:hypothetical protein